MKGSDADYFEKKLRLIARDIELYTPDELVRELLRLAVTATEKERKQDD